MRGRRVILSLRVPAALMILAAALTCNNPFATREPERPGTGGAAIKPANSPENVLYNLEAAFESLSIQDYLDVFTADFALHPDPEDSLAYEQEFASGWGIDRETTFANNFLLRQNFVTVDGSPIEITSSYEFKPGGGYYEYHYQMFVPLADVLGEGFETIEVEGYAFLFLREDGDGNWAVYDWLDHRIAASSITWSVLRAQHI